MSVIEDVKQRTDIVGVVSQYVALKKAGRNLSGLCPFHSERHPSFFVYPEQQSWHCFGCNTGGDVLSFVMKKENLDFGEALRLLAEKAGVTIPSRAPRGEEKEAKERLYKANETAAQFFHNLLLNSSEGEKARGYLASRGLSAKTVADFQLGFSLNSWDSLKQYLLERGYTEDELVRAGLVVEAENGRTHDRFRNKLMFPILDIKGRVIGFGARVLDDSLPKYVNSPQTPLFDKSASLYGINLAAPSIRQQDVAVIVEGYMDVITAHQSGFSNVVASMGTSVTERQVSTLKKLTRNMILALDADAAGEEAMLRGISYENILEAEVRVVILPEGKDPDNVIREDAKSWPQLIAQAVPIMDYTFNMVAAKLDLTQARDKSLAVERLLPVIADMKDTVRQAHYLQKLASLVRVDVRTIEAKLGEMRRRESKRQAQAPRPEAPAQAARPLMSNRREEYCLALLLRYPELKSVEVNLRPEYFSSSENREIFTAWMQTDDLSALKEKLDISIQEHLDSLLNWNLPPNHIEPKFIDCALNLEKEYWKNWEARKAEALALEAEAKGAGADLAKLEEEGIAPALRLKEIYTQGRQRRPEPRR
ncbi:MAG TPA: DNA primase [Dehalococcoidia bacterium]|jgi:DNA primase|nr:DNA primase [Dehalococcoidia bacterium]